MELYADLGPGVARSVSYESEAKPEGQIASEDEVELEPLSAVGFDFVLES